MDVHMKNSFCDNLTDFMIPEMDGCDCLTLKEMNIVGIINNFFWLFRTSVTPLSEVKKIALLYQGRSWGKHGDSPVINDWEQMLNTQELIGSRSSIEWMTFVVFYIIKHL